MGQALYRKYRPKSLQEVVGQEHIARSLTSALKNGKLSHAYLFTGPRGVGKTSIARILAHEINDIPYKDDASHLDIIEIDAASNRRIEEIRELRDKVHTAPAIAKYKVYIVDEVHMLTREAFNALLKTLEEPPAHVVFILATTEAHKLPETIVSRTQRFLFRPVPVEKVTEHLREIADKENMVIDDAALHLIARHGEGSFRDSISLLDQTRGSGDRIDEAVVRTLIGLPTDEAIEQVASTLRTHDSQALVTCLASLGEQGFSATHIARQLGQYLREQALEGKINAALFSILEKLLEVPIAHDPERYLELILLEHVLTFTPVHTNVVVTAQPTSPQHPTKHPAKETPIPPNKPADNKKIPGNNVTEKFIVQQPSSNATVVAAAQFDDTLWPHVLSALKSKHNTLYGVARMARPVITPDTIELYFKFAFHKKRIAEAKNQTILGDILERLTGTAIPIRCELDTNQQTPESIATSTPAPTNSKAAVGDPSITAISNVFGSAELLSS